MNVRLLRVVALATLFALPSIARAHENRPLYIEVLETDPLVFVVQWKVPPTVSPRNEPDVALPEGCEALTPRGSATGGGRRVFRCSEDPAGGTLALEYPVFNPSVSTLVRITRHTGESHTLLGTPAETGLAIPTRESFASVAKQYLTLGMRHILEGYDHLLFLVCLLLIAGTGRRILITVTGFTIAHSLTLVLSALHVVNVPLPPVEAAIALSIVFLAVEIVRGDEHSLTYRYPIAVASTFGLLHGFGFAAVLGETGLPQTEVTAALLFFNVGVELGQLTFIAIVVLAYQVMRWLTATMGERPLSLSDLRRFEVPTAYVVGALASFWMIERVAGFWSS